MSATGKFLTGLFAAVLGFLLFFVAIRWGGESLFGRRPPLRHERPTSAVAEAPALPVDAQAIAAVYARSCASCHGEKGDGQGIAARFLDPKPRNFALGFRLVTSSAQPVNPSAADIEAVLVRGMPGSSMISWAHLSAAERHGLADHVLSLRKERAKDVRKAAAQQEGEEATQEDLDDAVKNVTTLGPAVEVPPLGEATPEALRRGQEIFVSKGCASCHGNDGKGGGVEKMLTTDGYVQRPRDLTLGIFKGNPDAPSLYHRIRIGLPGSAMPGLPAAIVADEDVAPLIHYVRSLSDDAARDQWVQKRKQIVAKKVGDLAVEPDSAAWESAEAVSVAVAKLWWEPFFRNPSLQVRAQHDGKRLAVRLSWKDDSKNDRSHRPEEFEDMAAIQLYRGEHEPFLGMGSKDSPIDLWLWRAGWSEAYPDSLAKMDEYPFQQKVAGFTEKKGPAPDFLTARAAGNVNINADRSLAASNLLARGFGSTTFRPRTSQIVGAKARHASGGWDVVLVRNLDVKSDEGLSLAADQRVSAAFAIWNGQAMDRNGQKAITIWHDLVIER